MNPAQCTFRATAMRIRTIRTIPTATTDIRTSGAPASVSRLTSGRTDTVFMVDTVSHTAVEDLRMVDMVSHPVEVSDTVGVSRMEASRTVVALLDIWVVVTGRRARK